MASRNFFLSHFSRYFFVFCLQRSLISQYTFHNLNFRNFQLYVQYFQAKFIFLYYIFNTQLTVGSLYFQSKIFLHKFISSPKFYFSIHSSVGAQICAFSTLSLRTRRIQPIFYYKCCSLLEDPVLCSVHSLYCITNAVRYFEDLTIRIQPTSIYRLFHYKYSGL